LISGVNPGFAYSYGNRFREDIDQVARVASILRSDRSSRRAIIHTWRIDTDLGGIEVPCVQTIQFVLRNNRLNAVVYIRSNDILLAWGANAYGITALLAHMCCLVQGCTIGSITMISAIAHIYDKRDADIIRRVTDDIMDCRR
jgi:thymidylate synthase